MPGCHDCDTILALHGDPAQIKEYDNDSNDAWLAFNDDCVGSCAQSKCQKVDQPFDLRTHEGGMPAEMLIHTHLSYTCHVVPHENVEEYKHRCPTERNGNRPHRDLTGVVTLGMLENTGFRRCHAPFACKTRSVGDVTRITLRFCFRPICPNSKHIVIFVLGFSQTNAVFLSLSDLTSQHPCRHS